MPFTIVLTDNCGYGCINRLQIECGGAAFNNMYKDSNVVMLPEVDFVAHAAALRLCALRFLVVGDGDNGVYRGGGDCSWNRRARGPGDRPQWH
ncbi:MAG: hypothetical protein ACPGO3_01020 [Magnetospiraceae bacterium]